MRTVSAELNTRKIAPMLADWNRSQSFPTPTKPNVLVNGSRDNPSSSIDTTAHGHPGHDETGIFVEGLPRKTSLPLTASNVSIGPPTFTNEGKRLVIA